MIDLIKGASFWRFFLGCIGAFVLVGAIATASIMIHLKIIIVTADSRIRTQVKAECLKARVDNGSKKSD